MPNDQKPPHAIPKPNTEKKRDPSADHPNEGEQTREEAESTILSDRRGPMEDSEVVPDKK